MTRSLKPREAKKGQGAMPPCGVQGTGACRAQRAKQAGGASEIARSDACAATMQVSRTRAPERGLGQPPQRPPNSPDPTRSPQTRISPLSPKAVYGGECVKQLRASQSARLCKEWFNTPHKHFAPESFSCQTEPGYAITDRQGSLRSLTAFFFHRFAIRGTMGRLSGKRNSRASAPFRFQTFRPPSSATGGGGLQSPIPRLGLCPPPHQGHCPWTLHRFAPV